MRRLTFGIVCICAVLSFTSLAGATNYYVAPSGSDSNPGTIGSPWATPLKAWTDANAGDTVYFRAGSYAVNTQIWTKYFGHSGTADNPIVFRNYESESVTFTSTLTGQVFRIEKSYNYVQGINFVGGATWFQVAYDVAATNFKASHCTAKMSYGGDNTGFVCLGTKAANTIVEHCRIIGPGYGSDIPQNTAGIHNFSAVGLKALHNEISNVPVGIYFKHANPQNNPTPDIEIAYNFIHETGRWPMMFNCNYAYIHDNLIGANNRPTEVNEANGLPGGDYNTFEHNTFYGTDAFLNLYYNTSSGDTVPGAIGNTLRNNVFCAKTYMHEYSATAHQTISNYNLYPIGNDFRENYINYTLAAWRTRYPTMDANSITGAAIFVGGTSPSALADFALSSTSPGKNAASDGKDMGADISQVGIQNAAPPTAANDSYSVYANHTLMVSAATGLLLNDTGTGTLTATKMTDPSHGSLSLSSDGGFVYTPTTSFGGSDSFTYKVHNSAGDSNTATVSITVNLLAGDITGDGYVDGGDLNILLSNWNASNATWATGDLTGDGFVDGGDLNILLSNWNSGTAPAGTTENQVATGIGNTYYVAPPASGGSDSNPGTIGSPWLTLEKALATAAAGDTVYFRGGTHTASGSYYPSATAHAGTSDSPITLKSYPGETATITGNNISYYIRVEQPYWIFDGLTFIANNLLGSGGCIILNGENYNGHHMTVRNCSFQIVSSNSVDNVACVRLQSGRSNYALIQNNTFAGFHAASRGQSGVQYLGGTNVGSKILNNNFHDFWLGIYVKHANSDTSLSTGAEIAYNYFYSIDSAALYGNPVYINYHDNLIVGTIIDFGDNGGGIQGHHNTVNHNTVYNKGLVFEYHSEGAITYCNLTNNVFMGQANINYYAPVGFQHYTTLDYNLYITGSSAIAECGSNYSLASWKTHYGQDAHSLAGAPIFVGGTAPTTIAGFALSSTSPGKNAASDGKDMGADIGQVGIQLAATAVNDSYSVNANHTLTVSAATGVLANDTGSAPMTAIKVTDPSHGSLSLSSDGGFVYTPTTGFGGSDSFTYKANNPRGDSNTATVTITVNLLAGDITGDGYVDGGDLNILLSNWNANNATWATGDLTGDGFVDGGDLNILLSNWNAGTQPAGNAMNSETITTSASVETGVAASVVQNARLSIQINFQPASVVAPQGYVVDSGLPFGAVANGYTYGWTTDLSSFAVQCNNTASLDVRYDTAIMLVAGGTWEMSVPNGMYDVKIVSGAGDSGSVSAQKFTVEGVPATQIQSQANVGWSEETVTVVVTDGKLTIVGNPGSSICFVQITGR
jgi:hypothetical protein